MNRRAAAGAVRSPAPADYSPRMPWPQLLVAALVGLLALDRLLRWMERRGWIFYRQRKPSGSGIANALGEFEAILNPAVREVVVARQEQRAQDDDDDDDGDPPGRPRAARLSRARQRRVPKDMSRRP